LSTRTAAATPTGATGRWRRGQRRRWLLPKGTGNERSSGDGGGGGGGGGGYGVSYTSLLPGRRGEAVTSAGKIFVN